MAHTTEPSLTAGLDPESILKKAVAAEITSILEDRTRAGHLLQFFLLSRFGLDIGVFTRNVHSASVRFVELKAFAGARPGGVGFGNPRGEGVQIDLLMQDQRALLLADEFIRWVIWDATQTQGMKRFAVCTNSVVKAAAMGGVRVGKQNNLRVHDVMKKAVTWAQLSTELDRFLGT